MQQSILAKDTQEFKLYKKRFMVVVLFGLVQMMISLVMNTLTPIASYLAVIYDTSPVVVNLGSLLFALMHPIFTFPAAFVIDTYGTRIGIMIGSVLGMGGVLLRLLTNSHFLWVIAGQVLAGIGRPFILNCQAKISANWFSANNRGTVTQILTLILNGSLVLGIFLPGIIFSGYKPDDTDPDSINKGKDLTFNLMMVQMAIGAVCFSVNIFFQSSKPPTPPSESGNIVREPFKIAIRKIFLNRNYVLLWIAFGLYFGIFNAISIILSHLLRPWFGDENLPIAVTAVGCCPVVSGIIGVMILGPLQKKSKIFKKWILICMAGSLVAIMLFYPLLETNSLVFACLVSAANALFLIPLVPIMLELGCELVFPIGEGVAVGLLFANGNLCGFGLGLILSVIVQGHSKMQSLFGLIFCFCFFLLGLGLAIFMKEEKNREKFESESSKKRSTSTVTDDKIAQDASSDGLRQSLLSNDALTGEPEERKSSQGQPQEKQKQKAGED